MTDKNKNKEISVEYLVDLLSSIKSALGNIDSNGDSLQKLVSDLSENFTVLSELSKRQYQDSKEITDHLSKIQKSIQDLDVSNQIVHADVSNKVDHAMKLINSFNEINRDVRFVAENLRKQEIVKSTKDEIKSSQKENRFIKWSGNLTKVFTNLDNFGKAIVGIIISIIMLISVFKAFGGNFSDIISLGKSSTLRIK